MENQNLWVTIYRVWNHFNWANQGEQKVEISAESIYDLTSKIDERVENPFGYSSVGEVQKAMDQLAKKGHLEKISDKEYSAVSSHGFENNFPAEYMKAGNSVLGKWCQKWKQDK